MLHKKTKPAAKERVDNESSGRETQSEPEIESDDQNDPTPDDTATKKHKGY